MLENGIASVALSIVTPAYNVDAVITPCLESLAIQQRQDIEFIFVDDGSTDSTASMLNHFAENDARARVIHRENGGVSSARNAALDIACGNYVAFVDADDHVVPGFADGILDAAQSLDADIVVFGGSSNPPVGWVDETLEVATGVVEDDGCNAILSRRGCIPFLWNKAYRRSLLDEQRARFIEGMSIGEDASFQFETFPYAHRIAFIPDKLYCYQSAREGSAMERVKKQPLAMQLANLRVLDHAFDALDSAGYLQDHKAQALESLQFFIFDARQLPASECSEFAEGFKKVFSKHFSEDDLLKLPERYANLYRLYLRWSSDSAIVRATAISGNRLKQTLKRGLK